MRTSKTLLLAMIAFGAAGIGTARAATQVSKTTFQGAQVPLQFESSTSITCADGSGGFASVFGFLSGAEQIFTQTGQPTFGGNGTFVEIDSFFDSCTGVFFSAEGAVSGGFTAPDKKLTSASMTGSGTVQDFSTASTFPVSLNITVVGTGSTSQSKDSSHSKLTGTTHGNLSITVSHSANSNRSGTVTGSITVAGVTFNSLETFFALLISNSNSAHTVSKP